MNLDRAKRGRRELWQGALLALALVFMATPVLAAASVTLSVDEGDMRMSSGKAVYTMRVDVQTTIKLTVTNGKVSQPIPWPKVDGLVLNGTGQQPGLRGGITEYNFFVTPTRAGDFTVPAFDIRTDDGQTLHIDPIKFHVNAS
jgi:hypothetical protein